MMFTLVHTNVHNINLNASRNMFFKQSQIIDKLYQILQAFSSNATRLKYSNLLFKGTLAYLKIALYFTLFI